MLVVKVIATTGVMAVPPLALMVAVVSSVWSPVAVRWTAVPSLTLAR